MAAHTHTHIDLFLCVFVCVPSSASRPTLIRADGCHGSGSHLLHGSINSVDLDTDCKAPTDSGGEITDPSTKTLWTHNNDNLKPPV